MKSQDIAHAFSLGQFSLVFKYLAEDIEWNIVGEQHLKGLKNITAHCTDIQSHFNHVQHQFTIHAQHQCSNTIIIQGCAEFHHSTGTTIIQACDIYTFNSSHQLKRIESYCITT